MYRLHALFASEANAPERRAKFNLDGMRSVLAPRLTRYITLKDVSVEAVFDDAKHFYRTKSMIYYRIDLRTFKVEKQNGHLAASYALSYGWQDDDLPVAHPRTENCPEILRYKHVKALVQVFFDPMVHVVSYTETYQRNNFPVVKTTWGTKNLVDAVGFLAQREASPKIVKVKIPKGVVVEDDFDDLSVSGSNSDLEDDFHRVRFNGELLWARVSRSADRKTDGELYINRNAP